MNKDVEKEARRLLFSIGVHVLESLWPETLAWASSQQPTAKALAERYLYDLVEHVHKYGGESAPRGVLA